MFVVPVGYIDLFCLLIWMVYLYDHIYVNIPFLPC